MSCEVPLIATRAGALPEVLGEDNEGGILVPPEDPQALADAIKHLLANEQLRRGLGEAGRKRIEKHFTWEEAAKKTLKIYEEVL
jgi:glycosyltransferase involved in cell wall biosynthesis